MCVENLIRERAGVSLVGIERVRGSVFNNERLRRCRMKTRIIKVEEQ